MSTSAAPAPAPDATSGILPGRVGNLTPEQQQILDQYRKELQEEGWFVPERHDDRMLLRFLRARKFDLARAKEMIIAAEKWRKDFGVDQIIKEFEFQEKAEVDKYYPQFYHKTDKDGRPVYVEVLGKLDIPKLYAVTSQDRLLKRLVLEYERFLAQRLPASSEECGHEVETVCTILDLNNVALSKFYSVKDYVMTAAKIGQDYYPECMGKFYIINAPYLFSGVWALIRPWLDEVTVKKIQIMSNGHKAVLLQQIPMENLPAEFGGKCACPGGCSMSDAGPWNKGQASTSASASATTSAQVPTPAPAAT